MIGVFSSSKRKSLLSRFKALKLNEIYFAIAFFALITLVSVHFSHSNSGRSTIPPRNVLLTGEQNIITLTTPSTSNFSTVSQTNSSNISNENLELSPCEISESCSRWLTKMRRSLNCIYKACAILYHYHVRKAGGTTVRQYLMSIGSRMHINYLETEGLSLDYRFLNKDSIVTFTSFRHPIDRIISLYWYEHVLYYHKIQKKPGKASSMLTWVNHWKDSNPWKQSFNANNTNNLYIEVENYYVKILSNWNGTTPITRKDLDKAKLVLQSIDIVLIMEQLSSPITAQTFDLITASYGLYTPSVNRKFLPGDRQIIAKYGASLASNEVW
jgi:hypothetical protein